MTSAWKSQADREWTGTTAHVQGRQLSWYAHLVHNQTVIGSLATLLHLPFMLAFLSFVLIGDLAVPGTNLTVLALSLLVVSLLLYAEHMLDDMVRVGKPWSTVFSDRTLAEFAIVLFVLSGAIGIYASFVFSTPIPFLGVLAGIMFCVLYGLEVWEFHRTEFGSLGMGAICAFSYLAQALVIGSSVDPLTVIALFATGLVLGYIMLWLYEYTKTKEHQRAWRLLGYHLIIIYALAGAMIWVRSG